MLISSAIVEPIRSDDDSIVLAICKTGTFASDENGKIFRFTENALKSSAPSWVGGKIRINHKHPEQGTITESWFESPFLMARISGLTEKTRAVIESPAYMGVSQDSLPVELGEVSTIKSHAVQDIEQATGTGVSIMIYPETPACPLSEGCGVPIKSSEPDVFNSPLNTESPKIDTEPLGGPSMDETIPTIDELKAKITTLEARNADLEGQIANHPKQIEAALASHEVKIKQMIRDENELNAAVAELKSCMPEGFEEFMATTPTKATIDATIKGMRSKNPIGAPAGVKSSLPEVFSSGKDIYAKLGLTAEEVAKVNGGV